MMASTHALYGMAAAMAIATVLPEAAPQALFAGFVGGFVPDLDVYASHRRTLHAPVYGSAVAGLAVGVAFLTPGPLTVVVASAAVGAALHAVMDVGGGGLSLEPWADQPERAVYSHFHGWWLRPRRWVAYDGSPGDLVLAFAAGLPLLVTATGSLRLLVAGALALSVAYALLRKRLVGILLAVLERTPDRLQRFVPRRVEDARR